MATLTGTTAEPRIQDVTKQIERIHRIYGASDYTAPHRHASGKSLNYATGASIQTAELNTVTVIPYTLKYEDNVGLFGAENHFIKVKLNVTGDVLLKCFEERNWECAAIGERLPEENYWTLAKITEDVPANQIDANYEEADMTKAALRDANSYLSIYLINKQTGLKCNDAWLDVRLYNEAREEHPYNTMYVKASDTFYIGFHARNTRRLGYDVECVVGEEYVSYEQIEDKRYIMSR